MPPIIDKKKCIQCGMCAQICPMDVIKQEEASKIPQIKYADECWHCRACVIDCPKQAITIRYPLSHLMLHNDGSYEEDNGR